MGRRMRAIRWAYETYTYQRTKPHGSRATVRNAALLAWMGAHIIWAPGRRWRWTSPAFWLLLIGRHRISRTQQ